MDVLKINDDDDDDDLAIAPHVKRVQSPYFALLNNNLMSDLPERRFNEGDYSILTNTYNNNNNNNKLIMPCV